MGNRSLNEVSEKIAQGIVTSLDDVYFLYKHDRGIKSSATGKTHKLESSIIHPLLKGSVHMKRWLPLETDRVVLFPYEQYRGEWRLIPPQRMEENYPLAWEYLLENQKRLKQRESGRMQKEPGWYGYIYPKNLDVMNRAKILVPAIAQNAEYSIDERGKFHYVGSGGGGGGGHAILPIKSLDLHYLCGILNSAALDFFLKCITTPFHSGWFAYSKAYIAQIPIKIPESAAEKKLAARIVDSVQEIMAAKLKLRGSALSDRDQTTWQREVEQHERRIDEATFQLYGVDGLPQ